MPYVKNGDINIYYEVEGEGPPLLIHHGLGGNLEGLKDGGYVNGLKNDYQLILIDSRGHGKSDKPHEPEAYTLENKVEDVICVLDELNIVQATFFGFSMGGRIGLAFAKLYPARLKSLIIGGIGPKAGNRDNHKQLIENLRAGPEAQISFRERSGPLSEREKETIRTNDNEALIADVSNPSDTDFEGDLPLMTMPIFVFVGEADIFFPHEELKEAYSKVPDLTFITLPGLDHAPALKRSDLVLPHIKEFLAKVSN